MTTLRQISIVLAIVTTAACGSSDVTDEPKSFSLSYTESTEDFPNPERGFYRYSITSGSNYQSLSETTLKAYRTPMKSGSGNYEIFSTLVFRYYVLDVFKDSPISNEFLSKMRTDYSTARAAGVKIIPRFTYTNEANAGDCDEGFICPPYGDAPKETVLDHILQLKPIFQENADVIACVQMGFIGVWGEQYYTDYFGDASNSGQGKLLDENWNDRIEVLNALLDAVPAEIMVQVRYPQIKQRAVYGIQAPTSSAPLDEAEAFDASKKARIAFHNDCFLASADDYGTYADYGNSTSDRRDARTVMRSYFAADSKYVAVGGETCADGYSPTNDCEPQGKAMQEMAEMHYSFLNADYNNAVNNDWQDGGCMDEIKRKLGYRFVLKSGTFPSNATSGESIAIQLSGENVGYATPYNEKNVFLVLRHVESKKLYKIPLEEDPRYWFTSFSIEKTLTIPSVEGGTYELLLHIADKHEALVDRPEYSIRLANTEMWEEQSGMNNLGHLIEIR